MAEIRLELFKERDQITIRGDFTGPGRGPGEERSRSLDFKPSKEDYDDLRWYLKAYPDFPDVGAVTRAKRVEKSVAQWGQWFFRMVFDAGGFRELFR